MVKYEVGGIYDTPKGKIKILARTPGKRFPDGKRRHPRIIIEIVKTGTILNVQSGNIATGKFTDYMEPSVYGVGFIGSNIQIPARGTSIIRRIYDLWANMLKRAYGGYKTSYKEISVDTRWHNFTNFLNTIQEVPNYEAWEENSNFNLDKDIIRKGNKVYSKETCMFVPPLINQSDCAMRRWHGLNYPMLTD